MTAPSTAGLPTHIVAFARATGIEPETLARIRDTGCTYEISSKWLTPPVHRIRGPRGVVAEWTGETGWLAVGEPDDGEQWNS